MMAVDTTPSREVLKIDLDMEAPESVDERYGIRRTQLHLQRKQRDNPARIHLLRTCVRPM